MSGKSAKKARGTYHGGERKAAAAALVRELMSLGPTLEELYEKRAVLFESNAFYDTLMRGKRGSR